MNTLEFKQLRVLLEKEEEKSLRSNGVFLLLLLEDWKKNNR